MTVTVSPEWFGLILLGVSLGLAVRRGRRERAERRALEAEVRKLRHLNEQANRDRDNNWDDATRKGEELHLLYEVARKLGASDHPGEALQVVLSMIRTLRIPYHSCLLFLVGEPGKLELALRETDCQETPIVDHPLVQQVVRERKAQIVGSCLLSQELSVLLVPLLVRNELVGLIYLGSLRRGTHQPKHLEKLKALAALAAPSIRTARLFGTQADRLEAERLTRAAIEAKNRQLSGLQSFSAALGASLNLSETLRAAGDTLRQIIPHSQSVIFFLPDERSLIRMEYASSPYVDYVGGLALRPDEGLLGRASQCLEALLVRHAHDSPSLIHKERCAIVAALRAEGQTLGFVYVGAVAVDDLGEEQRQLVTTVACQTALAVNNARLYEKTQQMAVTDGLTGLYLHRYFQERLTEEIARADRSNKTVCLIMVDTDHFKAYNDTLGHPAGDSLLKDIAALLRDKVRSSDIVCRYGGDEFAIILNDIPKDEAVRTCERIRESFQLRFARVAVQVTASIGMACYPSDATTKADLARLADEALYVSKRGGRNRVSLAPPRQAN